MRALTSTGALSVHCQFRAAMINPKFLLAGVVLLFSTLIWSITAEAADVTGIRFGVNGLETRVVLDIDRALKIEPAAQTTPPRLVVDLPAVNWRLRQHPQSRPVGMARSFRYGQLGPNRSRLVVDMAAPFKLSNVQLLPPSADASHWRLVIDVAPGGAPLIAPRTSGSAGVRAVPLAPAPLPAARPADRGEPEPPAPVAPAKPMIAIDAGHGGIDPGAIAIDGTLEKDITLAMARDLASALEASGRYRAFLVRNSDEFIKLRERIDRARRQNADIFISLHADSSDKPGLRGSSVYTLSENASDREAAKLAAKENKADIIDGADLTQADADLTRILIDMSLRLAKNDAINFADLLVEELRDVAKLVKNTRRYAGFAVLKAPDVPSVLVELGYLSNSKDARRLADPQHREEITDAMLRALDIYFGNLRESL